MILTATIRDEDGKTGYHGQAKVEIGGKRYQCQAQLVAIKEKAKGEDGQLAAQDVARSAT
jgi:hypothetical protein